MVFTGPPTLCGKGVSRMYMVEDATEDGNLQRWTWPLCTQFGPQQQGAGCSSAGQATRTYKLIRKLLGTSISVCIFALAAISGN